MIIDPTTPIGQVRLRVADFSDLPILPDEVYQATLDSTDGNIPKTSKIIAGYILGSLAFNTHRKLQQLEVWGAEAFTNYRNFLKDTINNPNDLSNFFPIAYVPQDAHCLNPLIEFVNDWNNSYAGTTQSEDLAFTASLKYPKTCCPKPIT